MNEIIEYDEISSKIDEVKEVCNFIPDATTKEGYEKSKRVSLAVGKILTTLEKSRRDKKAQYIDGGKRVDSQAKAIKLTLESMQLPHKEAYKNIDDAKKRREAERKQCLEDRVERMRDLPNAMRDMDSESIKLALESLHAEECLDFYEYTEHALKARNSSKKELASMFDNTLKREAETKELEVLRAQQAAQDQKDRDARIIADATAKEKAEAEQRAQNKAHQKAINHEAMSDLIMHGMCEGEAKALIKAIVNREIKHINISY